MAAAIELGRRRMLPVIGAVCLLMPSWAAGQGSPVDSSATKVQWLAQAQLDSASGRRVVTLPHQLAASDLPASGAGRVRYTLTVDLPQLPTEPMAVYVPKLSLAGELQLNGRSAGRCAPTVLEQARCLHHPQLFEPPDDAWRVGRNTLVLTVYGNDRQPNGLSAVRLGALEAVRELHGQRHLWQVEALHVFTAALLAVSLLALAAAATRGMVWPQRRTLLLLGVAGVVNALCDLNMLIEVPPVGFELYSWFTFVARLESMPLYVLTLLSFYGALPRWLSRGTWVAMAAMALAVWLSGNSPALVRWLYVPLGLGASAAFLYTVWLAYKSRRRHHAAMVAVSVVLLVAGWWDFAKVQGALAFERLYLLPYAYPATLLVMGYLLLRWLSQAMAAQQRLSMSLEQQLAEREEALRQAHARERAAERRRIRDEERVALLSHVHDGLGSQLVSARMALQHGEISVARAAEILAESSDDLRLVLSTLNRPQASLPESIGDFRHRLQIRLASAPVKVDWKVSLEGLPLLSAHDVLQILRVLQEAVTNALRHAAASQLHIELTWFADEGLRLVVADNGRGLSPEVTDGLADAGTRAATTGWGMENLRQRASALGAELGLVTGATGTRVTLHWRPPAITPPVPEADAAALPA